MWTGAEYAFNASTQTIRIARREVMSFLGKNQTRKMTKRRMKGNVTNDEGDDDEEDDGGYSVLVCPLCQW